MPLSRMGLAAAVVAATLGLGSASAAAQTVRVRRGDTLTSIARRYGTTVGALARANHVRDSNRILAGQHLSVPDPTAEVSDESGASQTSAGGTGAGGPVRPSSSQRWLVPLFQQWAAHYGVSAPLLEALTWWESGWQTRIVSSSGAVGIGQLEPATVRQMRRALGVPRLSAWSASDNIRMSAAFLAHLLDRTGGSTQQALGAYYQGLASVRAHGLYSSTRHYVAGILAYEQLFAAGS